MADQQPQGNSLAALFPSPPQFYEAFTSENLRRIRKLRKVQDFQSKEDTSQKVADGQSPSKFPLRVFDLPPELRFLQPPNPPAEGKYRSFGDIYDLSEALPSLESQGIQQLYTPPTSPSPEDPSPQHHDRALILKRLSKSLLLNFLELMGIMSANPSQYLEKVEDLRTMFINFHHLLNEYRPHQARESLILMMEEQIRRVNGEVEGVEKMKGRVEEVLRGIETSGQVPELDAARTDNHAGNETLQETGSKKPGYDELAQKFLWTELDKEFS